MTWQIDGEAPFSKKHQSILGKLSFLFLQLQSLAHTSIYNTADGNKAGKMFSSQDNQKKKSQTELWYKEQGTAVVHNSIQRGGLASGQKQEVRADCVYRDGM